MEDLEAVTEVVVAASVEAVVVVAVLHQWDHLSKLLRSLRCLMFAKVKSLRCALKPACPFLRVWSTLTTRSSSAKLMMSSDPCLLQEYKSFPTRIQACKHQPSKRETK